LGTTQDGVISGQKSANKKYFPKLTSVTYGSAGSKAIKELQRRLGISQSGQFDKSTITQLQYFLGWTGLYCPSGCVYKGNYDGYFGVNTAKALQAYLNWY
jgi:peptidoglycan hydrolase-like protein with peptidoglycan-binding domain